MTDNELKARFDGLTKLIEDTSASLQREMREGTERIEKVTGRHSGIIVSGTVAIAALTKSVTTQDKAIRDLQTRVRKLEGRRRNGKAAK